MNKYNFIVIGADYYDIYKYAYYELKSLDYAYYDSDFLNIDFVSKCFRRIHWKSRLPGKYVWINKSLKKYKTIIDSFNNQRPVCFLILGWNAKLEKFGLSKCIHEMYPNSKIVWYFCDLIAKNSDRRDFFNIYDKNISAVYSFDYSDAKEYGLLFHNLPYSFISEMFQNKKNEYDVCFVGQAKDRLKDILNAHDQLKQKGLKCYFLITGVKEKEQMYCEDISYSDPISYSEYLDIVSKSKCILELMQKGGTGNTIRVPEAIAFGKILLTNNQSLKNNDLFDKENMFVFENASDIPVSFIMNRDKIKYTNKDNILPSKFFRDIENVLN